MKHQVPGTEEEAAFAFICYEDPTNKEYGPKCATDAIKDLNGTEIEGKTIYVREALKKTEREQEKKKELYKFKNSKRRCNLFVRNLPNETTKEELETIFS